MVCDPRKDKPLILGGLIVTADPQVEAARMPLMLMVRLFRIWDCTGMIPRIANLSSY
jgi:hypothetical protein